MSYKNVLVNEIMNVLEDLRGRKKNWNAKLIAKSICDTHKNEIIPGSEFTEYNVYQNVRNEVQRAISKLAGDEPNDNGKYGQMTLPGFKHLQFYYTFNNEAVHIDNMTPNQWDQKEKFLEKIGKAAYEHRAEMQKYRQLSAVAV